jgi:hypothetical protein
MLPGNGRVRVQCEEGFLLVRTTLNREKGRPLRPAPLTIPISMCSSGYSDHRPTVLPTEARGGRSIRFGE